MEKSLHRELLQVADHPIPQIMAELADALADTGPALAFGAIHRYLVPAEIAVVTATSGSSGEAKEVALGARAILTSARGSNQFLGATPGQKWSLLLPLTHIAGINVLARSLDLGSEPVDLRAATIFQPADFTAIVPTQLFRALNGDLQLLDHLKNCQAVLVGGAALSNSMAKAAEEVGIRVIQTYGMSETSGGCIYNNIPLEGVEVRTVNGVIHLKGPTLASGYLNDEQAWANSFNEGWFITSDRGEYVNGLLTVEGRVDDVIITGGVNISLTAIEESLKSQFAGTDFAAFAVADSEWGSALHIASAGDTPPLDEEISSWLAQTLGVAAKPKGFHRLSSLPLIGVGKVDRRALSQLAAGLTSEENK